MLQKLNQLETEINKPVNEKQRLSKYTHRSSKEGVDENFSSNVNRLENMAQLMNDKGEGDPEIKKLDTVLEKILDIQHPERIKEKIKDKAGQNKKEVLPVKRDENLPTVSLFGNDDSMNQNLNENRAAGFYGLNDNSDFASTSQNAVDAVIHETQTLVSGSVVKLRLLSSISINGNLISKDNFVFGIAKLNGERLQIEISSITSDNSIYPVSLEVYDLDGLPGIYIPGAITRDVAKQSANNSLQSMGFSTLDPSLTVQATTAGINAD